MDDALFGFKTKQQDSQKLKPATDEPKVSERPKLQVKKHSNVSDFPEGDLLADISLSDDEFYDLGKKPPLDSKSRDKVQISAPEEVNQDKLDKSKRIANLFGLDDSDDVAADSKKKQQGAADWLGIKESPVKAASVSLSDNNPGILSRKNSLTATTGGVGQIVAKSSRETKNNDITDTKTQLAKVITSAESVDVNKPFEKPKADVKRTDFPKVRGAKTVEVYDLLGDKAELKSAEIKEKKSAIFDELFGDHDASRNSVSRRNSAGKILEEKINNEATDNSVEKPGQYTPSSGVARRPGLGRRRETTTPPASLLFQEDWLLSSNQQEAKKEIPPVSKSEVKPPPAEESLPTWLGGSGVLPEAKPVIKPQSSAEQEIPMEKTGLSDKQISDKQGPVLAAPLEPVKQHKHQPEDQITQSVGEAMIRNSEQSQQMALALQRTEAQLLAAVELQTAQSDLAAVCARQRRLLDNQERQLAQLVARQTERQGLMESQLQKQQDRIQQLLEVLSTNTLPTTLDVEAHSQASKGVEVNEDKERNKEVVNDLEVEVRKVTLDNEELRQKIKLMEKYHKMEFESLEVQHRREIESWEDRLTKQKELSDQLRDEFKERIARLKENEAELINEHNQRVRRLREEQAEDMRQLMQFHKMSLEQFTLFGQLVTTSSREEHKPPVQTWKPLEANQISEKEEDLHRKEKMLNALQEKLEKQRDSSEKELEEMEAKLQDEKIKNEEISKQLKHEQTQLKYKQQQLNQEKKFMEEQYYVQRKSLEEMQEKVMSEQTQLATDKLSLAEERAKLDALAKLQGVSGTASFDMIQAKAEVHGALEAARTVEAEAVEERRRLRERERLLETQRWKLREIEEDLAAKSDYFDRVVQAAQASQQDSQKALEEAKEMEQRANEKLQEVERRRKEVLEKEQSLIRLKLDITKEEMRLDKKRQQLELVLPKLSFDEALTLQPIKDVIDPKMLIMKLRAERELEAFVKPQTAEEN
ncbi:calponin homology domain-containing protein DDB_G0272472-like isoform X2 [Homalodisca vitripennis]|nr:calponin homology domain-containing protein DDB_G0272472-like isoform X2 [Homalodisca vitripennis]